MARQSSDTALKKSESPSREMGYIPYPAYKDSGIEWLGEIPEHWRVKRLKYSATINDETLPETTDLDFVMSYVDISGVDLHRGIVSSAEMTFEDAPSRARRVVRDGDTIVSTVRTYLGAITPIRNPVSNTIVSTGFAVIRPREIFSDFMSYLLRESSLVGEIVSRSLGVSYPAVNASEVGTLPILLPDLDEQRDIAAFLDCETAKIDMLVEKQERLIDLLQERRTALISHAVTKGLDSNIPMKDSGIEWLSEIPTHWEVKRLGQIGTFKKCNGGTKDDESPDGIPCVRYGDIYTHHDFFVRQCCSHISSESVVNYTSIRYGDILFAGSGETLDEIAKSAVNLINTEVYCGGDVILLKVDIEADACFMGYAVGAPQAAHQKALMGRGITVMHIYGSQLKHLSIAIPPTIEEQQAIAAFLDHETAKIDDLITKIHQVIKLQKELRSALISAAVTGKIDVRQTSVSTA